LQILVAATGMVRLSIVESLKKVPQNGWFGC